MNNKNVLLKLNKLGACSRAIKWAAQHGGTSQELWNDCNRGDWMWWLLRHTKLPSKKQSVAFANFCTSNAKYYAFATDVAFTTAIAAFVAADAAANAVFVAVDADAEKKVQADYIRANFKCPL